jgi:Sulfatase
MRTASLLIVLVSAKLAMLAGHHIALSWWSPAAYLWQDAAVVLLFAALEFCLRRRVRVAWGLYAAAALYAAINIPVAHVLSTPLTWPMLRAARGPLADSIRYYVTWPNALLFTATVAVAALSPILIKRPPVAPLLAVLTVCVALGPAAAARVDTHGLDRNAWTALLPPPRAGRFTTHMRGAEIPGHPARDLSAFRAAASGRNIVLISLESTAAQYLGIYGATPDVMPNLSTLARSAVVFDNAYAVYPESIKGLFSILCSTYPVSGSSESYAAAPCRPLPALLSAAGYRTALFHSGRFLYLGMESVIRGRGFDVLEDAGDIGGNRRSSFGVDEPSTVARMLRWIDGLPPGRPFFLTYLPIAGHHPYETPDPGPFPERDEFARYRNALHYGDASLATLIDGFRARSLEQKTVWIVLGDHGEAFGQHDGNYGHTFQLYDENIRVPFLIAAPGLIRRQIRAPQVVSLLDTAPTVLDLAGLAAPREHLGHSMLDPQWRMALFFADYSLGLVGLRDGPRKFIYELNSGRSRLFDVTRDPEEKTDLARADDVQSRAYRRLLLPAR